MRFEDVTHRFSTTYGPDGRPLNVAIPHFYRVRVWQAIYGGYSWSIMYEPGLDTWPDDEKAKWAGHTATYRKLGQTGSSNTIPVDGGPWASFNEAEQACKNVWKQLRQLT